MFVSADYLAIHYGVDDAVAKFFTDREPPANNLYWHEKLLYLRFEPGYLFLPLIVDLLLKQGIPRQELLSEKFVGLLEEIGHISAQEETQRINREEAVKLLLKAAAPVSTNDYFLPALLQFIKKEDSSFTHAHTGIDALHRGDAFLFSLAALPLNEDQYLQSVKIWVALISLLLLMDDAEDVQHDMKNNDENAFVEVGFTEAGLEKIKALVKNNLQLIASLNKTMAIKLDNEVKNVFNKPAFQQLYNQPIWH